MTSRQSERMLGRLFKHDIGGMLNVSQASLRPNIDLDTVGVTELALDGKDFDSMDDVEEGDMKNFGDPSELGAFEEFVGVVEAASERLAANYALTTIEDEIQYLKSFENERISPEPSNTRGPRDYVEQISGLAEAVGDYLNQVSETHESPDMKVEEVFETFEGHGEVDYNGLEESTVEGDGALCVVANTIALNALDHGGNPELHAEIKELDDRYKIDIWDDGEGLPEEYSPEEIFSKEVGNNSGLGLYLAREITEGFGGSLEYSEENAKREDGFGLQWTLAKPESGGNFREDEGADCFAD